MHYPIFVKAVILRQQGCIKDSLRVLEEAIRLDPQNPDNLKQVGHSLYLLGQHQVALDVFDEALHVYPNDWEIFHERGLCHLYLAQLPQCAPLLMHLSMQPSVWRGHAPIITMPFAKTTLFTSTELHFHVVEQKRHSKERLSWKLTRKHMSNWEKFLSCKIVKVKLWQCTRSL